MDVKCTNCGVVLVPSNVVYDQRGNVLCQKCLMDSQTLDSQVKVSMKVKGIAYGGPALGLIAFLYNPAWLFTAAAIGNGLYVLRSLHEGDTAKHLSKSLDKIRVAAIAGMVLGGVAGVLRV